jgi:hypothetical protein
MQKNILILQLFTVGPNLVYVRWSHALIELVIQLFGLTNLRVSF